MTSPLYIFDLDQTLYPLGHPFYKAVVGNLLEKMRLHRGWDKPTIDAEVARLRAEGHEPFVELVRTAGLSQAGFLGDYHLHQPYHLLEPAPETAALLKSLPGRKIILTHGLRPYSQRILARLGIEGVFEHIYDMADVGDEGKHNMDFAAFAKQLGVTP